MGLLTSIYLVLIVVSASVPPLVAVPLADAAGWRVAVGAWAVIAVVAAIPWLGLMRRDDQVVQPSVAARAYNVWAWPTSWAILVVFAVGALNMYAYVSWLPTVLTSSAHVAPAIAGLMLAIFNVIGIPHSFLIPPILAKARRPALLIWFAAACACVAPIGLAFAPTWSWLWIFPAGLGSIFLTVGIALINQRTRTPTGATALSGMVQGLGYLIAAVGPLFFGLLHQTMESWQGSFFFLAATAVIGLAAGLFAVRRVTLEDM